MYPLLSLKIPSFGLRISRSQVSGILDCWLLGSRQKQFTTNQADTFDLGHPQNHPEKSSNFKPVSRATKVMKIGSKATTNHEKWTLESWEIQLLRMSIFAIPPLPNARFFNPRHPDSNPKIIRKNNLESSMKSVAFLVHKYPKSSQNGLHKSPTNW